jgi:hypothetical protein
MIGYSALRLLFTRKMHECVTDGGGGRKLAVSMNEGAHNSLWLRATRTSTLPIKGPVQVIVGTAANHA